MPLYCCNCNCGDRDTSFRQERVLKEVNCIESIDEELKRLDLLCTLDTKCNCVLKEDYQLEKLKNATHDIKKLIDKVDDNLVLLKANKLKRSLDTCKVCEKEENERCIIDYLNKNCKNESKTYFCCDCYGKDKKTENEEIVELIRHKHSKHVKDTKRYPVTTYPTALDKHCEKCDLCWNDYKIRVRRDRSRSRSLSRRRSRSKSRNESDDDCYVSSDSYSYKPYEPWRAGPYTSSYPWKTEKIQDMNKP